MLYVDEIPYGSGQLLLPLVLWRDIGGFPEATPQSLALMLVSHSPRDKPTPLGLWPFLSWLPKPDPCFLGQSLYFDLMLLA